MCGKRWINSAVTTWKFMVTNNILEALFVKLVRVNIPYACGHRFLHVALPVLSSLYCYIGFCKICKCNLRNKSWILSHNHNSTKSQFQCQNIPCFILSDVSGKDSQRRIQFQLRYREDRQEISKIFFIHYFTCIVPYLSMELHSRRYTRYLYLD